MSVIRRLRARLVGARGDRGAVATTVALLLGSGVLLGMAALVVDVGNLYAERGQLQNGADAGAIKVAQICATDPTDCSPEATDLQGVAESYAERNADDGTAAATVCGRGGRLSACPSWENRLTDCVGPPPAGVSYAEVHTSTRGDDGFTPVLPPVFAQAVVGGYKGAQVGACSRVAWGPPARATTLALTISACDWNRYNRNGFSTVERSFPVYDEKTSTTCTPASDAGDGGPGGYRFLEDTDDACRTGSTLGDSRRVYTGDSWPVRCKGDTLRDLVKAGRPVLVPVFGEISGTGGNAEYTVSGFAAFVVTGWHLPDLDVPSPERSSCEGGVRFCVFGYFTQTLVPGGGAIGGLDLGARVVAPIG